MNKICEQFRWMLWQRWPGRMPAPLRRRILELSPWRCDQIAQGEPMVVMHRESWEAGVYARIPGTPFNLDGENWIIREWLRTHPGWRP